MLRQRSKAVDAPPLVFRGLDLCDGCGATLKPGDQLSGLCPACQGPQNMEAIPTSRPPNA